MKSIYGIDVSGASLDVRHISGSRAKQFQNNPKGFAKLAAWARDAELFVMEATGSHHTALAEDLHGRGFAVSVANPARAKHYAQSMGIRNKTDQVDALILAQFGGANSLALYTPLPAWQRQLRAWVRARDNLVRHLASLKVQRQEPDLDEFVESHLKALIAFNANQLKQLESQIRQHVRTNTEVSVLFAKLRTIPGVGEVLAWTFLAELGTCEQFESAKEVAAFAGVCPAERQSGTKRWTTRMSKAGNAELRKALYMPALAAVRTANVFQSLYIRLIAKGKSKLSALGAVMHKLVRVAYGVLRTRTPFIAEGLAKT